MKTMNLLVVAALGVSSISGVGMARTNAIAKAPEARADVYMRHVTELRNSLTPAQRDQLLRAANDWSISPNTDKVYAQVERDVNRIMTPDQAGKFMDLVTPDISGGGIYMRMMCVANSALGLLFSTVGLIGCNGDVAGMATIDSYAAFIFANNCLLTGASSCESAVSASYNSAGGWASLIESCDVADTAYYTMALTYATCGGTWE